MVWGARNAGIDDLLQRLQANDPKLTSLTLLRQRKLDGLQVGIAFVSRLMLGAQTTCEPPLQQTCVCSLVALQTQQGCKHTVRHVHTLLTPVQDVERLCAALSSNTTLTELNITSHAIDPPSAAALARLLQSNTTLHSLSIGTSSFGDEGVAALAPGVGNLTSLNLEGKVGPCCLG
jgi:hypothetical protein